MPEILYSHRSVRDLEKIAEYLKNKEHDPLPFLQELKERIELLAHQPLMGVPCVNKGIEKECRIYFTGNYLIVYRFNRREKNIFILNVFHQSVNYPKKV